MVKKFNSIVLIAFVGSILALGGQVIIEGPTARTSGDNIVVQWKSGDESGVKEYQIWRSGGQGAVFIHVASVFPKGNNSQYEFIDRSVFKAEASIYYYKVIVIFTDNSQSHSSICTVSYLSSTARRTWGSIKAMFR
ncbi:MAG: hypothetical protein N3A63_03980 [Bacteroidetes bacterium]|nr:hypothetical protein [Bacteroidota bacterium]